MRYLKVNKLTEHVMKREYEVANVQNRIRDKARRYRFVRTPRRTRLSAGLQPDVNALQAPSFQAPSFRDAHANLHKLEKEREFLEVLATFVVALFTSPCTSDSSYIRFA